MDYKKTNAPTNTVTRDIIALSNDTGNVYETLRIIGKRANQISVEMKNDLEKKLQEFASYNDNLSFSDVSSSICFLSSLFSSSRFFLSIGYNREQIEISRYYEKLPKPTLIATQEYLEGKVYYKNPTKEKEEL